MTTDYVGTPAYTAPEQVRGVELTGACDQYALACVLFECLTGRLPFPDPTVVGLMQAHIAQPPPPVSAFAPALGDAIDRVVLRALAKEPSSRYASCAAFIAAASTALGRTHTTTGGRLASAATTTATAAETDAGEAMTLDSTIGPVLTATEAPEHRVANRGTPRCSRAETRQDGR